MTVGLETVATPSRLQLWITRLTYTVAGTGSELIFRFLRTLFLSHLLTRAEFGVTTALSVVIFLSELVSDIGMGPFILNKAGGADDEVLATAHAIQIIRGLILTVGVYLLAPYLAAFFGVPELTSSFALLAWVPLIRSFSHLGVKQAQRSYDYRPEAISSVASQLISLILGVAAGFMLRDHRAIIVALVAEAAVFTFATFRLSPAPFVAKVAPGVGSDALAYGLPLMVSGLVGAFASQFDRMMVGHFFGVEALAGYGIILTIALVPLSSLYRVVSSIASAMLARDRDAPEHLEASYMLAAWAFTLIAFIYGSGLALGLDVVTPLVFGRSYQVVGPVHLLVTLIAFTRTLRWSPGLLLLALGATRQFAVSNAVNAACVLAGVGLVLIHKDLTSILVSVLIGDIVSNAVVLHASLERLPGIRHEIRILNIVCVLGGILLGVALFLLPEQSWRDRSLLAAVLAPYTLVFCFGALRSWSRREEIKRRT